MSPAHPSTAAGWPANLARRHPEVDLPARWRPEDRRRPIDYRGSVAPASQRPPAQRSAPRRTVTGSAVRRARRHRRHPRIRLTGTSSCRCRAERSVGHRLRPAVSCLPGLVVPTASCLAHPMVSRRGRSSPDSDQASRHMTATAIVLHMAAQNRAGATRNRDTVTPITMRRADLRPPERSPVRQRPMRHAQHPPLGPVDRISTCAPAGPRRPSTAATLPHGDRRDAACRQIGHHGRQTDPAGDGVPVAPSPACAAAATAGIGQHLQTSAVDQAA